MCFSTDALTEEEALGKFEQWSVKSVSLRAVVWLTSYVAYLHYKVSVSCFYYCNEVRKNKTSLLFVVVNHVRD